MWPAGPLLIFPTLRLAGVCRLAAVSLPAPPPFPGDVERAQPANVDHPKLAC